MAKNNKLRVLLTAGGTGGHIYPIIAISSELQILAGRKGIDLELRYLGSCGNYKELIEANGIKVQTVAESKLRRYFSLSNFIDAPKFVFSFFQALCKIYWFMPDLVFSKGGPGALAVILASRFYRIPVIIHESDSIPGLTNQISSKYAELITASFSSTGKYFADRETVVVGNPIRKNLIIGIENESQTKEKRFLEFSSDLPLIIVMGGSQGSTRINEFILDNIQEILKITQVFHQTGKDNYNQIANEFEFIAKNIPEEAKSRYKVIDYFENDIRGAMIAADAVVSRAGAGAIFEIAAFGKPSILIPLPEAAQNHQLANAYEYSSSGAAIVIEEENLLPNLFINTLQKLFKNPEESQKFSDNARKFSKPEAALNLAKIIIKLGGYD